MDGDAPTAVVLSPGTAARPLRLRRPPRASELALLRSLAAGPAPVRAGPVGRCSKRGWCRPILVRKGRGQGATGTTMFELTVAGRAVIDAGDAP